MTPKRPLVVGSRSELVRYGVFVPSGLCCRGTLCSLLTDVCVKAGVAATAPDHQPVIKDVTKSFVREMFP